MIANNKALVLFSGGQDSTTCLMWALSRYPYVETIGFDYQQRHATELTQRPIILQKLRAHLPLWDERLGQDHCIRLPFMPELSKTAMIHDTEIKMQGNGLRNTFVPGRNMLFLLIAATLAYKHNLGIVVGGMCGTDFHNYPDCRDDTIKALQVAINIGMEAHLSLETPLMRLTKADAWKLVHTLGGTALLEVIRLETHTCYLGARDTLHAWGYGCGSCPACILRAQGYHEFLQMHD